VSNIGGWIQTIAIGVFATETTGKAAWTGIVAAVGYLPAVVLGPVGGALADRYDRRKILALLTVVQVLLASALALLALTGHLALEALVGLVFLNGCANALAGPAFSALLTEMVEPEALLSAISLTSGQFNLARMIGPVLAAVALTGGGIKAAFLANAVSYLAVLVALAGTPPSRRTRAREPEGLRQGIAKGLQVAWDDRGIRLALLLVLAMAVLVAPFIGLIPAFAIKGFGRGGGATSLMVTFQGAGALAAAVFANAAAERWGVRSLLARSLSAVGPVAACYWLAPTFPSALVLLAPLGGVYLWTMSALNTTCMGRVGRDLQARMSSLYTVTLSGGYALGLLLQGSLADLFGLRVVPTVAAGMLFAVAVVLWRKRAFGVVESPCAYGGFIRPGARGASG